MSAVIVDFSLSRNADESAVIVMNPPVPIGGWDIRFVVGRRFSSTDPVILKSVASGFNGASGITVTNSGQGIFTVSLNSIDSSGLAYGNYAYEAARYSSGNRNPITQGYILLGPSMG